MRKLMWLCALAVAACGAAVVATAQAPPASLVAPAAPAADDTFATFFTGATMRVDYFHTGGPAIPGEVFALDRVVADGAWPGSRRLAADPNGVADAADPAHVDDVLGTYMFEVVAPDSGPGAGRVMYARGFSSMFAEWATTPEARTAARTFHESLRFPWPKAPVHVRVKKREGASRWREVWATDVDPASRFVNRADRAAAGQVWTLFENGPTDQKVDVLLIGEGYTASELPKFHRDAARLTDVLFTYEPFKSRKTDFNVRGLDLPSAESGITRPRAGQFRRTPLSAEYNIFDLDRYLLTYDNRAFRDAASAAPYDVVEILVNDDQYGGGGIFHTMSTAAVNAARADYVFVHEFAHNSAGLGDEYVGNVTYETGAPVKLEPWEPNLTALADPARLKWRDLVEPGTPIPTPSTLAGKVGAFEGGGYESQGLYRPEFACIMGSTGPVGFCRVCQRAISRAIDGEK